MTTVHFAGLNTAPIARQLERRPVLISYADVIRRPGVWAKSMLPRLLSRRYPSVILDSGAFTELSTPGFHVDVDEYARFTLDHLHLFDYVVGLDDIRGNVARTMANQRRLEELGVPAMPVFHQSEPWEVLDEYADTNVHIGVGFQRPIKGAEDFLAEFFQRLAGRASVHGFGMTRYGLEGWPFATVDSTSWIAEVRGLMTRTRGKHSASGLVWETLLGAYDKDQLTEIVLSSYAAYSPIYRERIDDPHRDTIRGQAKTPLERFSAEELECVLERIGTVPAEVRYMLEAWDSYALVDC